MQLIFPLAGAGVPAALAHFEAVAVDPDGPPVTRVEFLADDQVVGVSDRSNEVFPTVLGVRVLHKAPWANPTPGIHTIRARATVNGAVLAETLPFRVSILDGIVINPPTPVLKVALVEPQNRFMAPAAKPIQLTAEVSSSEPVTGVDFLARSGDRIVEIGRVTAPPWKVSWDNPPPGIVSLVARARTANTRAESAPVLGQFTRVQTTLPIVQLVASFPDTTEPAPHIRIRPGAFRISRKGDTSSPLRVVFAVGGTAINGRDYRFLDGDLTLGVGETEREIEVFPQQDEVPEPAETVVLRIRPDDAYVIGDAAGAVVTIHDSSFVGAAKIVFTEPRSGTPFTAPANIRLAATAVDPAGYIDRVEFLANGRPIGVSQITFIRAPDPGTPIAHELAWADVPAGLFVLTAVGTDPAGHRVVSEPLLLAVRPVIAPPPQIRHPADIAPADDVLDESEVSTYAQAWRAGAGSDGVPVPIGHLTRAGFLWRAGGGYRVAPLAGTLPLAWVSTSAAAEPVPGKDFLPPFDPNGEIPNLGDLIPPRLPLHYLLAELPRVDGESKYGLVLRTGPVTGTRSHAVEVRLAPGTTVEGISEGGVYEPRTAVIRWGPFHDDTPRRLEASVATPAARWFRAVGSFDGRDIPAVLIAPAPPVPGDGEVAPRIAAVESLRNGGVQLIVIGGSKDPAAEAEIEVSTDLIHWLRVARTPAALDASVQVDGDANDAEARFYRVIRRQP